MGVSKLSGGHRDNNAFELPERVFELPIPELHSDVTATDLRVGSLCEIVYAEGGGLEVAIARGGWKGIGESLSALFEY